MSDGEQEDSMEKKQIKHKRHDNKRYMEHEQHSKHRAYETAAWTFGILTVVLAILFIVSLATKGFAGAGGTATAGNLKAISENELKTKTLDYLNGLLSGQGQTVTVDSIKDEGDLYSLKINIGGRPYDSFARKDGSILFPSGIDLTQDVTPAANAQPAQTNVPKADKPKVELFVMSHCPYGTQAEKGILLAVRTLGDKVDFQVKFVYYAMHGKKEVDEQLKQYCIKTEQADKYLSYLACFLNASDGESCLDTAKVDRTKLSTCIPTADTKFDVTKNWNDQSSWLSGQFPLFNTDAADNKKYNVGGSPTLIINGVQSNAGRDSASYLAAICNAMTTPAAECTTQLSAVAPGPGFGYDSVGSAQAAGCGV